ncbi:MAG TPA: hypothetical protein VLG49_05610 [Rhabdochlamydiaceae bacterium]|nr:hypothetical protein [Rhabdochlamydiaceae bacterium]
MEIEQWLEQFELQDREAASLLLEHIDYFTYPLMMEGLKTLHGQLLVKLKEDGFISNSTIEHHYESVDFSKTYVAKSGDLVSYFYRNANKIRSVSFKNLSDLPADKKDRALILLDDYIGTGTQFLYRAYAKENYQLFNEYKKVYLVVLVANTSAIKKFKKIKNGDYQSLTQEFISFLKIEDEKAKQNIEQILRRVPSGKVELIYLIEEKSLVELDSETREKIQILLDKYKFKGSLQTNFFDSLSLESYGHTAFFYSCPNNLPAILWNSKLIQTNGSPWVPIFKRIEDISIYDRSRNVPVEDHVW